MDKKRLIKYLLLTFIITWICWWADALLIKVTDLSEGDILPMVLFTVGGFGPTIAACICMEDGFSKTHLKKFLFNNSGKNWAFLFVALFLETVVFGGSSAGIISSIPRTPVAVIVVLIVFLQAAILYGGNEELGWRGIMQPILQQKMKSPIATFATGIVWVCWHIPLWFIEGNSHQSMSFFTFAILGIALSYWLSAIYNFTGAIVFCMIMHGWTNTLMGVLDIKESGTYYIGLLLLTMASIVASVKTEYKKKSNTLC